MRIKRFWKAISAGWVLEYPDSSKEFVHVFPRRCLITSRCCASELALSRAQLEDNPLSCLDRPLMLSNISQGEKTASGTNVESSPPPYSNCCQCGPPRDWNPYMSNTQTRQWLTEHFYAALRTEDLAAALQLANMYRYGDGNALNNMKFVDMRDIDGFQWARIVWKALGKSEI